MRFWNKLKNLTGQRDPKLCFDAPLSPDMAVFAVGDIHGCHDLLLEVLAKVDEHDPSLQSPLVFIGDYIDRGPDSAQVLRTLRSFQQETRRTVTCLMGNHEDMLVSFLAAPTLNASVWLRNGGRDTLASFGLEVDADFPDDDRLQKIRDDLQEAMGAELAIWVRDLPMMWNSGNVAFVHAGADPLRPLNKQTQRNFLWGHRDFFQQHRKDDVWVVHGHFIVPEVAAAAGRIAIDTGAHKHGLLPLVRVSDAGVEVLD